MHVPKASCRLPRHKVQDCLAPHRRHLAVVHYSCCASKVHCRGLYKPVSDLPHDLCPQEVEAQRAADVAELEAWLVDAPAVLAAALAATPALEDVVAKVQRPCCCFESKTAASPCRPR